MRLSVLLLSAALPLAIGACGQSDTAPSVANDAASSEAAIANNSASVPASGAQAFVNAAAASDRFEIETSKLAPGSAASNALMAYAREMVAAHTASSAKLKAIAGKDPVGITIDDTLNTSQNATLEDMKTKKGYLFDAAYLAAQVHAHEQALTELKAYAASGDNAELKAFVEGLLPTVTGHLEQAKALSQAK
ncbi:DUF4142 domain-containing protein [Sphingomonas daechungensis]|uniref:DUF4142 domain-containing protein n=1 Tax=Sphingomonas daechungensis TaxID=1176646 RepID=A0ABX6T2A3_9SPHN|nr:DUF4142 domain-containing protein [Sphingomonas daechungensis]QNP43348.1 DUF4142 domain-containing protein [Sphingomonas daechungensis]